MFVSPKFNCLFIHVPKTGGTTVREKFVQLDAQCLLFRDHMTSTECRNILQRPVWKKLFKFSIVRHPCDQIVSWYHHILRSPAHPMYFETVNRQFKDWIKFFADAHKERLCSKWLEQKLDMTLRFESLQDDFNTLCVKLGIPQDQAVLDRLNVGDNREQRPWTEYFDADSRWYMLDAFQDDFEKFGYEM